jgi:hypothetical protein
MRGGIIVLGLVLVVACKPDPSPSLPPQPPAVAPLRGATGDTDLRVMLAELASSKACGMIRGGFTGLRSPDHPDVVTGVLWIRECEISNVGARVSFHIAGTGWLWIDATKSKAGGTFTVRQYVRFSIATTIRGPLDIAYDRDAHVATAWFTPDHAPAVDFKTIGNIDVDVDGVWSSVVGAVGSTLSDSPTDLALGEATSQGTHEFNARLAEGLSVTINLCTGLRRVQLGRPAKGKMGKADVGETQSVPVEIQPGGVLIIGPQAADSGITLQAESTQGAVRLTLVCAKHAETVAAEFVAGHITSQVPVLGTVDVRGKARLQIQPTTCPVVVIATPLDDAPARFSWERPTSEIAHSTGGPLTHCRAAKSPAR